MFSHENVNFTIVNTNECSSHIKAVTRENWSSRFQPGPTQTDLYSFKERLEACNFGFEKQSDCIIQVAKTKVQLAVQY